MRRDAWLLVGPDSTIREASQPALDLLGMTFEELQALPPGGLSLEEDRAASQEFEAAWRETGGGVIVGVGTVRLLSGQLRRVRYQITPLGDGSYEILLEGSAEGVHQPPRTYTVGGVLNAWRAAERRLAEVVPDSQEWLAAQQEISHFRAEYKRVTRERAARQT